MNIMENTGNILFSGNEDQAVWFVAINHEKWIGPMAASEIVGRIEKGELTWAHYGWRKTQTRWLRLCDIPEFQAAVPTEPNKVMGAAIQKQVSKAASSPPPWRRGWRCRPMRRAWGCSPTRLSTRRRRRRRS